MIRDLNPTTAPQSPIKLFQFPRMFGLPNLSPFCCKLETWLRITRIPYEIVEWIDPRKAPSGKLPFIEDDGVRIADTSRIIEHLVATRGVDPDAGLSAAQRATALLVRRTLEEHYVFVIIYTHLVRPEGRRHTDIRFSRVPALIRPLVARAVLAETKKVLWKQGIARHSEAEIVESGVQDWRAILAVRSSGPFFFGDEPTGIDAIVFATLASTLVPPVETPMAEFLRAQPGVVAYVERMRARFFPELRASAAA